MFQRVDHVEILPSDVERSLRFYIDVLGFKMGDRIAIKMPPMREVIYLTLGDTMIEMIAVDNPAPLSDLPWQVGYKALALEVTDMAAAVAWLKEKKVVINREPVDLGNSWRGEILDPDGLVIELRQWNRA